MLLCGVSVYIYIYTYDDDCAADALEQQQSEGGKSIRGTKDVA